MMLQRKFKTMISLTPVSVDALLYCLVHVPLSGALLRLFGYKYLVSRYCVDSPEDQTPDTADKEEVLNQILRGFMLALRYSPYRGTCLSRAVLLKGLLQRRKFSTKLQVGVNLQRGEVSAHAWLQSDSGYVLVGRQAASAFVPLAREVDITAVSSK